MAPKRLFAATFEPLIASKRLFPSTFERSIALKHLLAAAFERSIAPKHLFAGTSERSIAPRSTQVGSLGVPGSVDARVLPRIGGQDGLNLPAREERTCGPRRRRVDHAGTTLATRDFRP